MKGNLSDNEEKVNMISSFKINKKELKTIGELYLGRTRNCDEVELIEKNGGDEWIINGIQANLTKGIDSESISNRIEFFDSNSKKEVELKGFWKLLWEALEDLLLRVLFVCGIVIILLNYLVSNEPREIAWIDGFAILVAVFLASGVAAVNDYQKEKKFKALNDETNKNKKVTCLRNGELIDLEFGDVVVGDLVKLRNGMEIPADGFLVSGNGVKSDESAMTGETKAMKKEIYKKCLEINDDLQKKGESNSSDKHSVPSPVLVSGTKILDGVGTMLIIAVGMNSQIGKIQESLEENDELTPLQLKLDKIAKDIGYFGLISGIIIFLIILIRSVVQFSLGSKITTGAQLGLTIVDGIVIAITVLVVAIPEGLPLAVTISLAYSIKKMMKDNNLVRKLQACETMGGANIICSDKTGTLTQNKMYWTNFWNIKDNIVYDTQTSRVLEISNYTNEKTANILYNTIIYNSNEDPKYPTGNPTELAILKYFDLQNKDIVGDRNKIKPIFQASFNSKKKRMSTIIEIDGKIYSFMKGASEWMLKECVNILDLSNDSLIKLDQDRINDIEKAIEDMAKNSLRTIGILMKELSKLPSFEDKDDVDVLKYERNDYTLIGICGIKDIIRPEVPGSILKCENAGIQVKMVTGDNKITATAIAKEVNIIKSDDLNALVLEGPEFIDLVGGLVCKECRLPKEECEHKKREFVVKNMQKFKEISKNLKVLARSRPDDKLTLVTGYKELENVVAVTGDGTNDAPALKKANVGFAMNIAGTQFAKDASDILILDDNFKSIVEAVKWGRNIYDNIRKFLQFQLTVNIVAVLVTMISAAAYNVPIFSPVQMLWLNIIMDTFASLALATESPTDDLLLRKPHGKNDYIVNKKMAKHIIGQVIVQMTVVLLLFFAGPYFLPYYRNTQQRGSTIYIIFGTELTANDSHSADPSEHFTFNFNTFVMLQVFNFVNARKIKDEFNTFAGILKSYIFLLMIGIILVLQIIFVTFAGRGVGVIYGGLNYYQWFISIGFGAIGLIFNLLFKLIPEDKICIQVGRKETKRGDLKKRSTLSVRRVDHVNHIKIN